MMCWVCMQGAQGSQAQVLIGTRPGASAADVQGVAGSLQSAISSGAFLADLKAAGGGQCLLQAANSSLACCFACAQPRRTALP